MNGGYLTITNSCISFDQAISTTSSGGIYNGRGLTIYTTDQRGFVRPTIGGTERDIGAFEGF